MVLGVGFLTCSHLKAQGILALTMLHAAAYSHVKKLDPKKGAYRVFTAERAVGLAVELVHKLARDKKWLLGITHEDVQTVFVQSNLQVERDGRWVHAQECTLALKQADADLAIAIAKRQRKFFSDMDANIFYLDRYLEISGLRLDMQVDFSVRNQLAELAAGHLWVELKAMSTKGFDNNLKAHMQQLRSALPDAQAEVPSITGFILLACTIQKLTASTWDTPKLVVRLFAGGQELEVSPSGNIAGRGKCKTRTKPALGEVWASMEWRRPEGQAQGPLYASVASLLKKLGLPAGNVPKRCKHFNVALSKIPGFTGRVARTKLGGVSGSKPWVATKATLRENYKML